VGLEDLEFGVEGLMAFQLGVVVTVIEDGVALARPAVVTLAVGDENGYLSGVSITLAV
jgi:hypothetical protein